MALDPRQVSIIVTIGLASASVWSAIFAYVLISILATA